MSKKENLGNYFWRGGQRIEVEKEEEFFTAIVKDEAELERVRSLPGVSEVKPVQNRIFKVHVSRDQRDAAMKQYRSEELKGISHHAYRPKRSTNTRYYLTDNIIVRFGQDVLPERIEAIILEVGVRIIKEYPGSTNTFLLQVTHDAGKNPIKVANALANLEEVESAEPNLMNRFQKFYIPADTYFNRQWHLLSRKKTNLVADADVSATKAWDYTKGKRDVVIAIIDDGFDLNNPDFTGIDKVAHPKDYVDGDANPFPVTEHGDYHGTPCAGVALAEENGKGVIGVAPGCAFMPVRFPLTADDDFLWEIFDYVGKRADVISCSWGPPPVYAPLPQLLNDKFHELVTSGGVRKKGCVIVFATGNYNAPLNDPNNSSFIWKDYIYGLQEEKGPIFNGLAVHPDIIAVSASTSLNRKAAYSNWGKEVSVCAPSNNFHPLDGGVRVPGLGIWTTDNEQFGGGFTPGSRWTGDFGGTSSATPLVAGIAGLVISAYKDLNASNVKQILEETADKIKDLEPDPVLGLNKGSYDDNGHSEWFGYGKVNAARAVQQACKLYKKATRISDLTMRIIAKDNLAETGDFKIFKVTISDKMNVTLEGPEEGADFDLYLKQGSVPTTQDCDEKSASSLSTEKVVIQPIQFGDYYIMVRSYRGSGDFEVKVELESENCE